MRDTALLNCSVLPDKTNLCRFVIKSRFLRLNKGSAVLAVLVLSQINIGHYFLKDFYHHHKSKAYFGSNDTSMMDLKAVNYFRKKVPS